MAAMQRVRLNLPEPPDSTALHNYPIYEYLVAARLRARSDLRPMTNSTPPSTVFCTRMPDSRSPAPCIANGW